VKILVIGASGSGTTTLGRALSSQYGWKVIDTDNYYWELTEPRFLQKRKVDQRLKLILEEFQKYENVIVSGSIMNWGAELEDSFSLIVFLYLNSNIRVERLRKREEAQFGSVDPKFLQWASEYDSGPSEGRSLARHNQWLSERSCKIVRIEGDLTVSERLKIVQAALLNKVI